MCAAWKWLAGKCLTLTAMKQKLHWIWNARFQSDVLRTPHRWRIHSDPGGPSWYAHGLMDGSCAGSMADCTSSFTISGLPPPWLMSFPLTCLTGSGGLSDTADETGHTKSVLVVSRCLGSETRHSFVTRLRSHGSSCSRNTSHEF